MAKKKEKKDKNAKKEGKKLEEKKEVCETFEVEKDGEEKVITSCGEEPVKHADEKQIKNQEKILKNFLIIIGVIALFFIAFYFSSKLMTNFEYDGVKYEITREGDLIFYKTGLPAKVNGEQIIYNFYIRNDPRRLGEVEFYGGIVFAENMVLNVSEETSCEGDEIIAIANLVKLHEFVGTTVIKDPNASCDDLGRYVYMDIREGDETKVEKTGQACYELTFKDCEILEVTERVMIEIFSEINQNKIK